MTISGAKAFEIMYHRGRPLLMIAMLLAIGLRTIMGAPCCVDMASAAAPAEMTEMISHASHGDMTTDQHSEHADDPAANPCCSACGPNLPPEPMQFAAVNTTNGVPHPAAIRTLKTRPPYPAYEATGPPLLI